MSDDKNAAMAALSTGRLTTAERRKLQNQLAYQRKQEAQVAAAAAAARVAQPPFLPPILGLGPPRLGGTSRSGASSANSSSATSRASESSGSSSSILDIVGNIDPAVLVVSIGVGLAWNMARMVYLYAKNAIESPLSASSWM